ncbi:MAG: NTP transferase domain-containing protein [Bacteroidales bacterium]|jgi:CTP:phosphocholine cytidylyltransferase-like protein|nr:NTP transferase domain-containing protein [Bacteroidales bacterium]
MTKRGDDYLNKFKIDNAIILAAGFSSRFAPVCFDVPKGLLKAKNEILIERQIKQLNEKGIADISIVTGCFHEQFCYLKEKFGVRLIYNADYSTKNNFASVFAAKKYLGNTIITSSDLYFSKNIFQSHAYDAYYSSVYIQGPTEERGLKLDEDDKMIETFYHCSDVWITLGYAFFSKRFSENYIKIVEKIYNTQEYANKFWADIQDEYLLELFMYIKRCDKSDIYEFDYLEELWEFDSDFKAIEASNTMRFICQFLNCDERELSNFYPIKSDNTVIGCSFFYNNTKYNYFLNDKNIFTSNKE